MFEVIFDVETKRLFSDITSKDPGQLGISIVSAYTRVIDENGDENEGQMASFWEDDFINFWPLLQKADRIIGFNSLHFDVPALQPYALFRLEKLPHFDILDIIKQTLGHRISLSVLARETLGHGKIDSGLNAVMYWNQHDKQSLAKLQKYCEQDVLVTKELYDFGMKNGILHYTDKWNEPKKIKVDFSYPKIEQQNLQTSLF